MANITFSSPKMKKDLTVYATAGDTSTLLALAKEHKIPVDFECENGECGSCAVKVTILANKQPMGMHLTEKEKTVLNLAGKITKDQIQEAEVNDIPPPWRLACQFIVRNEDVLVSL
jgi:ferredoxin